MKTEREKLAAQLQETAAAANPRLREQRYEVKLEEPETAPATKLRRMETSGLLAEETNLRNGVLLKHTLPLEARLPQDTWYVMSFKTEGDGEGEFEGFDCRGIDPVDSTILRDLMCYLIGSDKTVADLRLHERTMSKQHAVVCFRLKKGTTATVCPYLMDLDSLNGTRLNGDLIESRRYYELLDRDVVTFGDGEWEHVFMKAPPLSDSGETAPLIELHEDPVDLVQLPPTATAPPQSAMLNALAPTTADDKFDTET